ncbi:DUF2399 domain-containing protein [Alicyclobacillus mengziensis]|uniref:DUF2399 domain-containing protein n=1 Tax=Alicyclobacillus mengziensis TaxID=2931921 RepID=A0A9X7W2Q3_9BACL|nr:DUF2399 domain-containing protein [Alicyclobacillus mengziensis]QSO49200.1 DUF2399 domain-containing protein [Alicyclobacillus mengziensis]
MGEDMDRESDWSNLESSDGEIVRAVYCSFGILLDDVSSLVLVTRLSGVAERPTALPLLTIDELAVTENPGPVFVVENPSVFGTLVDRTEGLGKEFTGASESRGDTRARTRRPDGSPLICTSGQPSVAALHLLDKLTSAGSTIYYSGDFDVAGIQMAVALADRYGKSFVPWRWQVADYLGVDHPDLPKLSDTDLTRLGEMRLPWESNAASEDSLLHAMKARGVKVFQEHLIEPLKKDYASDGLNR